MKKIFKKITLWFNLLFLVEVEKQAFEVLVVLKNTFEPRDYRFSQDELNSQQLHGLFYEDRMLKKLLSNKKNELKSIWSVIGFLRERGYIELSPISNYSISYNGITKVNELESFVFSSKRFAYFISLIGGFVYSIKLLVDVIKKIIYILPKSGL